METEIIIYVLVGFLVLLTLIRREMLKPVKKRVDRREGQRRKSRRRTHLGRRKHDFHEKCEDEDRRHSEDRRTGDKDRRHSDRRYNKS